MIKSILIEVTPNLMKCLEILEKAVKEMPPGDLKTQAEAALGYLTRTFSGEAQPMEGKGCAPGVLIIPE